MYGSILIATDGSELASKAVVQGISLAKQLNARVWITTVTEAWSSSDLARAARRGNQNPIGQYEEMVTAAAANILEGAAEVAKAAGVKVETVHVRDQHPAEGIIAAAKDKACDLIVMASHGRRGLASLLLGSETTKVLTHSKIPVLVCR